MSSIRESLSAKFGKKEYRDAFVAEQIFSRLPLKIRRIREEQELTQKKLGELSGMAQTWVSKLEDPNYGKLTVATLVKLASAFDVGLQIDFVPFSKVLDDAIQLSSDSFSVSRFENDLGFASSNLDGTNTVNISAAAEMGTTFATPIYPMPSTGEDAPTPPRSVSNGFQQQPLAA